jgi:DNA polymerase-3 subunit beta
MKHETFAVSAPSRELNKALKLMTAVVDRAATIPILTMIRVTAKDAALTFRVTDLDIEAEYSIAIEPGAPLDFVISPGILSRLIQGHDGQVAFAADGEHITITIGDMKARLRPLAPPEDYPILAANWGPTQVAVSHDVWSRLLQVCRPAISTEETRYYLNGIYIARPYKPVNDDRTLVGVATDGHRLGMQRTGVLWPFEGMIVPRKTCKILASLLKDMKEGEVLSRQSVAREVRTSDGRAGTGGFHATKFEWRAGDWLLRSKTIDGTFPDYTRVIPTYGDDCLIEVLLSTTAIRRLAMGRTTIVVAPDKNEMWVKPDPGLDMRVSIPIEGARGPTFGLNVAYLNDFGHLGPALRVRGNTPGDPLLIQTEDDATTLVIMPMRVEAHDQ